MNGWKSSRRIMLLAVGVVGICGFGWAWSQTGEAHKLENNSTPSFFWTWDRIEPDTAACAWLLRRFVQPGCEIRLISDRGRCADGIPFDVPLSDLTRTRTKSSFRVLREHYAVAGAALDPITRWMDEIETDGWDRKSSPEATQLEEQLRAAVAGAASGEQALVACHSILDALFESLDRAPRGGQ